MRSKGFWILPLFWLTGIWPATSQPVFLPYTGPTIAFPGVRIGFSVLAYDSETNHLPPLEYDLVAAPTNVALWTAL
ncbi:MAG: hypothetical protein NT154_06345, partial [Verrucomicrobia bacterium]|nr:hypothetical protein [Verrucomicrobiota bacterium]